MACHTENQRVLKDGALVIYQRTDVAKAVWHCRIKFPSLPYIRKSLKTANEQIAVSKAEKLYDDLRYRHERGLALRSPLMPLAIDEYLSWLEDEVEHGDAKPKKLADHRKLSRYVREFFENSPIDQITEADIDRYRDWRRTYWTRGPGAKRDYIEYERNGKVIRAPRPKMKQPAKSTLASEDVVLRAVFDRACKMGWINRDQVPEIKSERAKSNRRPDFSEQELRHLLDVADQRIRETNHPNTRYQRAMLYDFVGVLAFTGMRPFEAMKLQWSHIQPIVTVSGKSASKVYVSGKNKERSLVVRNEGDKHLANLLARSYQRPEHVREQRPLVFSMADGTPIKSFKKGLRALLDAAELRYDNLDRQRDAYSLRHYYATQRLLSRVSVYTLAENMGTSVAMIEKHYGHLKPELAADELIKEY